MRETYYINAKDLSSRHLAEDFIRDMEHLQINRIPVYFDDNGYKSGKIYRTDGKTMITGSEHWYHDNDEYPVLIGHESIKVELDEDLFTI